MDHQYRRWMFLTNHARVLRIIARDPDARLGTIAAACQITERTVQAIIADLEQADYLHGNGTDGAASTSSTSTSRSGTPPKPPAPAPSLNWLSMMRLSRRRRLLHR